MENGVREPAPKKNADTLATAFAANNGLSFISDLEISIPETAVLLALTLDTNLSVCTVLETNYAQNPQCKHVSLGSMNQVLQAVKRSKPRGWLQKNKHEKASKVDWLHFNGTLVISRAQTVSNKF